VRIAIITGVSRGLGKSLVQELLAKDVEVVGIGRLNVITLQNERYNFYLSDFANTENLETKARHIFSERIKREHKTIYLINNAAIPSPVGKVGDLDTKESIASLMVNLVSPLILTNVFIELLKNHPGNKCIINISSGAAHIPAQGSAPYCITKCGLEMLTKIIAIEQKNTKFNCVAIRPGLLDTDMQIFLRNQSEAKLPIVEMFKKFKEENQLRDPKEVAGEIIKNIIFGDIENGKIYTVTTGCGDSS